MLLFLILIILVFFLIENPVDFIKSFGKSASGKRLERILKSPHYQKGQFRNLHLTPQFTGEKSSFESLYTFFFKKSKQVSPSKKFQFIKTNLKTLPLNEDSFVWMGHSSYFLQIEGKKFLVDPVFSGNASPVHFMIKSFKGSDIYSPEDIPELDYLIITHDHWDHLDYKTVVAILPKVNKIITGLGTGAHLEYWGYDSSKIIELDWYESIELASKFKITAESSRHFSGRGLRKNQTIWASFVLETPLHKKIYLGGDSGYDSHFKTIGEKYGNIDLAILENGQYNPDWKYIHMLPGEQLQAMRDLNAKRLIPVHHTKFALSLHDWYEPLEKIHQFNTENLRVITPEIGEKVLWNDDSKVYLKWWEMYK